MKTKQIISLALMLALLVTVITGCGTKEGSSTNNNEESTSVVSAEMKENEEIVTRKTLFLPQVAYFFSSVFGSSGLLLF